MQALQRPFNYGLVDEADSVLIDDALNALILTTPEAKSGANKAEWAWASKVLSKFLSGIPFLDEY